MDNKKKEIDEKHGGSAVSAGMAGDPELSAGTAAGPGPTLHKSV